MDSSQFFLKPNVVIEPLFNRWYAWAHLISPATAARNIVNRHLKILSSYIQAPQLHQMAVKNPKMLGGPFIDYDGLRVEEIKHLKDETLKRQRNMIAFSEAINELDNMLRFQASGNTLENLYDSVPDILKGYVELVYDLNNNPSYRFYEALLYHSEFFQKESQSLSLFLSHNDDRPFVLSTPRLDSPDVLHLSVPFDHVGIDELCKMKRNPGSIEVIAEMLGVKDEDKALFSSFFTLKEHPIYRPYEGEKARMRYFGHACILIETKELTILIDPLISYYGYDSTVEHYSDVDLPDIIDYVLLTHNHQDHILLETLLPLRHKIRNIIVPRTTTGSLQDPNLKLMLNNIGFNNVFEIDDMETITYKNCAITGLPFTGEHGDLNIQAKACYHVAIGSFKFLFVADSRIVEKQLYNHIHKIIGDIDVIFLGMECEGAPYSWLYGPLFTKEIAREHDQLRRLSGSNCEKGMSIIETFNPKEVYVYAMGAEPWLEFISSIKYSPDSLPIVESDKLVYLCQQKGLISERLFGEKEILYTYEQEPITE